MNTRPNVSNTIQTGCKRYERSCYWSPVKIGSMLASITECELFENPLRVALQSDPSVVAIKRLSTCDDKQEPSLSSFMKFYELMEWRFDWDRRLTPIPWHPEVNLTRHERFLILKNVYRPIPVYNCYQ